MIAALALALVAAAGPPSAPGVAVLGLRPTLDDAFGDTRLEGIPESQRLRSQAESALAAVTGRPVLGHDDLRRLLGKSYLVDVFACRGEPMCLARGAAPLVTGGAAVSVVVGDYHAREGGLLLRLRRIDLITGRVLTESTFELPQGEASDLPAWRRHLAPLVSDTGSVRIVANVGGWACRLDGVDCLPAADGVLDEVPEGEHVLELSKEGYRRAARTLAVERNQVTRVAVALEELPVQLGAAPDPAARVPTFAAAVQKTVVRPFGALRVVMTGDDHNNGEREDQLVMPLASEERRPNVVVFTVPAVFGFAVQTPRSPAGWRLQGAVAGGWVKQTSAEIDSAYAEVLHDELGLRVVVGLAPSIFSALTPGTLTLPEGFGNLAPSLAGLTVEKKLGVVGAGVFVGKLKSQFADTFTPGAASPLPYVAARLAYVSDDVKGYLYHADYPLTVSLSGVLGWERVGPGEAEWVAANAPGAAAPAVEDLPVVIGGLELFVPLGSVFTVAGEAYYGQGARVFEGAAWQGPRLVLDTGRHRGLVSTGGWLQLVAMPNDVLDLRLIAGLDRVVHGLGVGVATTGARDVEENRLVALTLGWWAFDELALSVQLHQLATRYRDPALGTAVLYGLSVGGQLQF
jgi:hypothetical protein